VSQSASVMAVPPHMRDRSSPRELRCSRSEIGVSSVSKSLSAGRADESKPGNLVVFAFLRVQRRNLAAAHRGRGILLTSLVAAIIFGADLRIGPRHRPRGCRRWPAVLTERPDHQGEHNPAEGDHPIVVRRLSRNRGRLIVSRCGRAPHGLNEASVVSILQRSVGPEIRDLGNRRPRLMASCRHNAQEDPAWPRPRSPTHLFIDAAKEGFSARCPA